MPCLLKIKVIRARSLPVMDRQSSKADAYVEIRFANQYPLRTSIARRTLDPVWNENFRLEINDDAYLQNEPLEFRLLDYDSITANDLIGSVYIDLNSLLADEFEIDQQYSHSSSKRESVHIEGDDDDESPNPAGETGSLSSADRANGAGGEVVVSDSSRASHSSAASVRSSDSSHEGFIGETTGVLNTYTRTLGGWFPIYDTMCGIRGELKCQIILQYFGNVNPFSSSSAGIQVFSTPSPYLPLSAPIHTLGFISSVVTHIDPEYHWTDSFRTPRASNEARVRVLHKITGLLRRRMGRKALEMGANAIIGYRQWFDFEVEEKTITGRVVGTAVRIGAQKTISRRRASSAIDLPRATANDGQDAPAVDGIDTMVSDAQPRHIQYPATFMQNRRPSAVSQNSDSSSESNVPNEHASDASSVVTQSTSSSLSTSSLQSADNARNQKYAAACEILTFKSFPPGVVHRLGGLVSATSVKLIENDQSRTRELWFDDLRAEIKHHALAIGCSYIVGYTEQVTIRDEIILLVAYGTAAVLDFGPGPEQRGPAIEREEAGYYHAPSAAMRAPDTESPMFRPIDPQSAPQLPPPLRRRLSQLHQHAEGAENAAEHEHRAKPLGCRMCHASHDRQSLPYPMRFFRCGYCQKKAVPEILLTTIDIPLELDVIDGESCMIEAHICRPGSKSGGAANGPTTHGPANKPNESDNVPVSAGANPDGEKWRWFGMNKGSNIGPDSKLSGEAYAAHISDALPFVHYDLHRQLLYKLSVHGMNAIFGLKYQFSIGEDMIIAVATGTAVYVTGLPTPGPLHIKRNIDVLDEEDRSFIRIQDRIMRLSIANRRRLDRAFRKKRRAMIRHREQQRLAHTDTTRVRNSSITSRRRQQSVSKSAREHVRSSSVRPRHTRHSDESDESESGIVNGDGNNADESESADDADNVKLRNASRSSTPESKSSADSDSTTSSISRADRAEARRQRKIRARVAVQIDDDADEDLMAALLDIPLPPSFLLCNVERPPLFRGFFNTEARAFGLNNNGLLPDGLPQELLELSSSSESSSSSSSGSHASGMLSSSGSTSSSSSDGVDGPRTHTLREMSPDQIQTLVMVKRVTVDPYGKHPNRQLAELFNSIYSDLYTNLTYFARCAILGVDYKVQVVHDTPRDVQVVLSATVVGQCFAMLPRYSLNTHLAAGHRESSDVNSLPDGIANISVTGASDGPLPLAPGSSSGRVASTSASISAEDLAAEETHGVELTTLSYLPRRQITAYVGRISLHFVQEVHIDSLSKGPVGMGAFVFSFIAEVQALARAHTAARGGMALIALSIDQVQIIRDDRSQAYATISISGDVVRYAKAPEDVNVIN
ncbi:hypothetical protein GGH94_004121 [Coemansia aciculifera]|uniref:C2 domain-containing protein n=1 Tax=Coemansia aciculifera TaxID=417176 RepID=A0A9W8M543_9FUNG|nr:hypothetical protein GGH94_004121 [Coemansia aciculifera]